MPGNSVTRIFGVCWRVGEWRTAADSEETGSQAIAIEIARAAVDVPGAGTTDVGEAGAADA